MKRFLTLLALVALTITANAVIQSGSCGDNVTFVLNDDGTLVISGNGDMKNYTSSYAPWFDNRSKIIKVQIEDGVTSIGDYVFSGCSGLTSVIIPNSVTSIGDGAFYECSGLTSVTIPNSVTSIGNYAFRECSGLTSITIPNSVTSIGDGAFYGCSSLISITIPNSVTSIGWNAFKGCSGLISITIPNSVTSIGGSAFSGCSGLFSLIVEEGNPNYCSKDNVLFNKDRTELIYCAGANEGAYTIPNSVTSIGDAAFQGCSGLISVSIPNSVTSIGYQAFQFCSGLTSITIPNSVTSIGKWAFFECSSLTSITIPNSVTSIGDYVFSYCSGLTSVTIPNSVTSIGEYAFCGCSDLTSVIIPNSITSIGDWAFYSCSGLTSVTIPNSVTSIGENAFYGCSSVRTVYWNSNVQYSFDAKYINELYLGDDVTIVYKLANITSSIRKVVIGKNVEYIRQDAFTDAPLKEFHITGEKDIHLYPGVFANVNVGNCTLYVPKSRAEFYKTTAPWKDFGKIVDLDGNDFPEVTKPQCAVPTIAYENGELIYATETEGATIVSQISDTDINKFYTNRVPLTATYNITAYATKSGYDDSEVATATLHWIDGTLERDGGATNIIEPKRAILVSSRDGMIKASGLNDGEKVEAYTIDGKYIGSANTANNAAYISAQSGEVVVLKIGKESIKTIVK